MVASTSYLSHLIGCPHTLVAKQQSVSTDPRLTDGRVINAYRYMLSYRYLRLSRVMAFADNGEDWTEGQPVSGVQYKGTDGEIHKASAHLTIVCDGMYSSFRKQLAEPNMKQPSFFVALLLKGATLPYPNHGHVVIAKSSPVLFYPISSTEVGWEGQRLGRSIGKAAWQVPQPVWPDQGHAGWLALPTAMYMPVMPCLSEGMRLSWGRHMFIFGCRCVQRFQKQVQMQYVLPTSWGHVKG